MYQVSEAYKKDIRKTIRNFSYIKVNFRVVDPDAAESAVYSDTGRESWSGTPDLMDAIDVQNRYGTLEPGVWLLDGSVATLGGPSKYQGFVSTQFSDESNNLLFDSQIKLTLTFGDAYMFRGLGVDFDKVQNLYPKSIYIKGYYNEELVFEHSSEVTSSQFVLNQEVPAQPGFVNKLEFIFDSSRLPVHRLRVEEIILGVQKVFTENEIISATWQRTNDLMNTVIPSNNFSYTFYDTDKEYNPDNPEGLWEYLEGRQQVSFSLGYQLDDGSVEWIRCSKNFTDGRPSITKSNTLCEVTFNTVSRLEQLTEQYDEGVYVAEGATLYDLARAVLRWAGCVSTNGDDDFVLSNTLKNYKCFNPLPVLEAKQLVQLIANAGMCLLYVDREGVITMSPRPSQVEDFKFTLDDILSSAPDISKYPYLKNLSAKIRTVSVESESAEIASVEVADAVEQLFVIDYDESTEISIAVSSGLTLVSTVGIFAHRAKIVVTGTGVITITGKKLNENFITITKQFNTIGEDCAVENQLLGTLEQGYEYIDWMGEVLQKRNVYAFSDRGFPEIDEGDIVQLDTSFTDAKVANITGSTIEYNGALSSETEVLG